MKSLLSGLVKNRLPFLLFLAFACYLLFGIFHPFIHNHAVDGHLHDECDACLWIVISAGIFLFAMALCLVLFRVLTRHPAFAFDALVSRIDFPPPSRSPPLI